VLAPINPARHARSSSCAWLRAASRLLRRGLIAAPRPGVLKVSGRRASPTQPSPPARVEQRAVVVENSRRRPYANRHCLQKSGGPYINFGPAGSRTRPLHARRVGGSRQRTACAVTFSAPRSCTPTTRPCRCSRPATGRRRRAGSGPMCGMTVRQATTPHPLFGSPTRRIARASIPGNTGASR
jgi:hypothetical protein